MLIDDLLPRLLVDAPECPDIVARWALADAASELCQDALVWNEFQAPISLADGVGTYAIVLPTGARPQIVMSAQADGTPLFPRTMSQIERDFPNWRVPTGGLPRYFNSASGNESVRVFPIPLTADGALLNLRTAFCPANDATELPDSLVSGYLDLIILGARARLLMKPRKPWSDLKAGMLDDERFQAGKLDAKVDIMRDSVPATEFVQPRAFGF